MGEDLIDYLGILDAWRLRSAILQARIFPGKATVKKNCGHYLPRDWQFAMHTGVSSIDKGLETSNDGTVTLYMGPEAPKGKEGNWIPTAKGQQYYMLFRFYGADDPVFTKTWQLNDLELVE